MFGFKMSVITNKYQIKEFFIVDVILPCQVFAFESGTVGNLSWAGILELMVNHLNVIGWF
jgi:hypothetical protein